MGGSSRTPYAVIVMASRRETCFPETTDVLDRRRACLISDEAIKAMAGCHRRQTGSRRGGFGEVWRAYLARVPGASVTSVKARTTTTHQAPKSANSFASPTFSQTIRGGGAGAKLLAHTTPNPVFHHAASPLLARLARKRRCTPPENHPSVAGLGPFPTSAGTRTQRLKVG